MLGGTELSSCAVGVGVATNESWCMLPHSCVLTQCTSVTKPMSEASTNKRGRSSSSGDVSAPVVVKRERAPAACCLVPAM